MGIFKLKTALLGLTTVLAASTSLFADAVVDADCDNNQNEYGYYWYYYDDNAGVGKDDRLQSKTPGDASLISVLSTDTVNLADKKVKNYKFTPGTDEATQNSYASIPFTLGTTWPAVTYTGVAHPFVGIGTQLAPDGRTCDLTGATAVKFKIRSHTGAIQFIDFKIQILALDVYSQVLVPPEGAYAYHENREVPVSTDWEEQTVLISKLAQPAWLAKTSKAKMAFDIKTCTKLAWEVKEEDNPDATDDTIDIDDITIVGENYTYTPPAIWTHKEPTKPSTGEFATFEKLVANVSPLGTYWYAYNDAAIEGNSTVSETSASVSEDGRLLINLAAKTGSDGVGKGASLEYVLGKSVPQGNNTVAGFVGIGCNMYDSLSSTYWDATANKCNGIYFEYTTDGDLKKATVEISDMNDVADSLHPTRKDTRGSGVVYYRDLPATEKGVWNAVLIPFDSLIYHDDWAGSDSIPFDKTKIAKIQWKVQGAELKAGVLAIDNVWFPGVTDWPNTDPDAVKNFSHSNQSSGFNVSYLNGNVNVNWKNSTALTSGKISLVNTLGAVVSSASITKTTTSFSTQRLPAGMYFVKINAVNANGKTVAMQSKVSIVK